MAEAKLGAAPSAGLTVAIRSLALLWRLPFSPAHAGLLSRIEPCSCWVADSRKIDGIIVEYVQGVV